MHFLIFLLRPVTSTWGYWVPKHPATALFANHETWLTLEQAGNPLDSLILPVTVFACQLYSTASALPYKFASGLRKTFVPNLLFRTQLGVDITPAISSVHCYQLIAG